MLGAGGRRATLGASTCRSEMRVRVRGPGITGLRPGITGDCLCFKSRDKSHLGALPGDSKRARFLVTREGRQDFVSHEKAGSVPAGRGPPMAPFGATGR